MQKNEIDDKLIKSFSNSLRLIPINNTNKMTTSNYMKSHKYHTKILQKNFLKTLYQITIKERKIKHVHINFYIGSLKTELHLVSQANLSLTLPYFKRFT